jgi:hypothetical protein
MKKNASNDGGKAMYVTLGFLRLKLPKNPNTISHTTDDLP